MKTQKLLVAVIVLQSLVLLGQWTGTSIAAPRKAEAQDRVPAGVLMGAGSRDMAMLDELKALNAKLDRLTTTIESGKLTVMVTSDKK